MASYTLPRLGIGAVILDEEDRILLLLRKKHPEANKWSIPGGKVDPYETLEESTIREVREEVGVEVEIERLLCTAETISPDTEEHWVSIIYLTRLVSGEPRNIEPDKCGGVEWYALDDLPKNMACYTEPAMAGLRGEK